MNHSTIVILFIILTTTINIVYAEGINKCIGVDGNISYQYQKCENNGEKIELSSNRHDSFIGCYIGLKSPLYKDNEFNIKYKVQKSGDGQYELYQFDEENLLINIPLRRATTEELSELGKHFNGTFLYGLNMYFNPQEHSINDPGVMRFIGIYKVKDKQGNEVYTTYMAFKGGVVKRIECDTALNKLAQKNRWIKDNPLKKPEPASAPSKISRPKISNGCDKADLNNGIICVGKLIKGISNIDEAKDKYLQDVPHGLRVKTLIAVESEKEYIRTGRHSSKSCSPQEIITGITPTDSVACEAWESSWYCKQTFKWDCAPR